MNEIKGIIFDLGGVIINLDIPKSIRQFNQFAHRSFETVYSQTGQNELFDRFDKGQISEERFFKELQLNINSNVPLTQLKDAWNAMLLDFPADRLNLLLSLKCRYRTFLLSNTNETHISTFESHLNQQHGYKNLEPFFEKVYYSCRLGMRKPESRIFELVLHENGLNPKETLFIDDTLQHIQGAEKVGINAVLLSQNNEVSNVLKTHLVF